MRRVVKLLFALAAVGGLVAAAYLAAKPEPPEVAAKRVKRTSIEDTVPGVSTGVVEVARRVAVQAESWGRVREVRVKRGDRVKTGDVLVTLDDSDLRDQVRALEAAIPVLGARVRQAGTRADQLGRDQDRARRLFEAGSLPAAQAEQAASGKDLARLDREAASAALAQARVNLDVARAAVRKTTVRAPFDGVVLDVFAEVGQVAGSGLGGGASLGAGPARARGPRGRLRGQRLRRRGRGGLLAHPAGAAGDRDARRARPPARGRIGGGGVPVHLARARPEPDRAREGSPAGRGPRRGAAGYERERRGRGRVA
ncbi:MAG: biotin/lipoyl-binding protein [Deltaproteobacteria bacterium]|nr:biotin/lipoyl-binding protein [Deltaproteobacteria bacterium]